LIDVFGKTTLFRDPSPHNAYYVRDRHEPAGSVQDSGCPTFTSGDYLPHNVLNAFVDRPIAHASGVPLRFFPRQIVSTGTGARWQSLPLGLNHASPVDVTEHPTNHPTADDH
jgi:hypothetical protein